MSRHAPKRNRGVRYLKWVLATAVAAAGGSYLLAKPGANRAGAWAGVAACTLIGVFALYLKRWAIERSLKSSLAMVGILFALRLIVLGMGLGYSRAFGFNGVAFAAGFLSMYFVVQWIEIGYLARNQSRVDGEESG